MITALASLALLSAPGTLAEAPAQADDLVGRTFVTEWVIDDGQTRPLVDGTELQLSFPDDGDIGFLAGCNHHGAGLSIEDNRLIVDGFMSTLIGCPAERHEQDTWISDFLTSSPRYSVDDTRLVLQSGSDAVVLRDEAAVADPAPAEPAAVEPERSLQGTWELDGFVSGPASSSVPNGVEMRLTFEEDSLGITHTDCNTGGSAITMSDGSFDVEGIISTEIACAEPQAQVEAFVHAVLTGTVTYEIDGDQLTLRHATSCGITLHAVE